MAKKLRYFYRVDAGLKPIPGSLIARYDPPVNRDNGKWKELIDNGCCGQVPVIAVVTGNPATMNANDTVAYTLLNGPTPIAQNTQVFNTDVATTMNNLITALNTTYGAIATFTLQGTTVVATPVTGQDSSNWTATEVVTVNP